MFRHLDKKIQYIKDTFAQEDGALKNIGKDLPAEEKRMQIGADEGKILYTLTRMIGAKKIVEVGVLNGYSSVWFARALPNDGKLYALEKNKNRIGPCQDSFRSCGVDNKIELISGDAHLSLSNIQNKGPFDIMFIDAEKSGYCKYLDWAEKNIRKGGLIIGDNTFLFGKVYDGTEGKNVQVMKDFNIRLSDSKKYSSIILPTIEGMTVAVKEF